MSRKGDIKVGAFVLAGIVLGVLVIFLIGSERRIFASSVEYTAAFENVQGLKGGAPVEMGGVRIGQVESVRYSEDPGDSKIHVTMSVVEEESVRIRTDSVATVSPKGLLGDRQVSISKGDDDPLPPGSMIKTDEPDDMFGRLDSVAGKAEEAIVGVANVAKELSDEGLHKDIRGTADGMNTLLRQVTEGEGYANRFINDPKEAERISNTIDNFSKVAENLDETSRELSLTLREIRYTVGRVRTGPGFAHDVIYGEGPKKEIQQFGMAAEEVALTLRGVREGDGFAHDVLFGGDEETKDVLTNVNQLTADLRDIVRGVKEGKGTIGALLVDPSIYEDMKRLVGNVERNNVMRALVRYSIKKDERKPQVQVKTSSKE